MRDYRHTYRNTRGGSGESPAILIAAICGAYLVAEIAWDQIVSHFGF